jgi:ankyrin repeat protein
LLKDCLAQEEPKLDLNFKNSYKQTPLILAIKQRHVKSVLFLAKNGADINLPDGQQKMPPFLHVIKKNSVSLFNNFLTLGPDTHVTTPENKSPMTIAGEAGTQIAILNELLGMGFAIDHRDCHGRTPLMYAVRKAKFYEVEWWLNQGANPLSLDKHGKSALDYAKVNHDGRILRLVRTRANELNKINRLETADENAAVNEALTRMRAQTRESNKQHQENAKQAKQAKQAAAQAIEKQ